MTVRFPVFQGATFELPATYVDDLGAPKSLTGVTIVATIEMKTQTVTLSITVLDSAAGAYLMTATPAQTAAWDKGVWPLYVAYEQTVMAQLRRDIDLVALIPIREVA